MTNLFFFKTFIAVAETGSFRLAAEKNNITQPAVTQHIQSLEKEFHCVLFERSLNKITLTPDGQILMTYARQLLEIYANAHLKISENNKHFAGTIHIVSIYTMGLYQLKPILQHLLKKYPGINVNVEYMHQDDIYAAIKKGAADFGLIAYPKVMPGCTIKIFSEEEMILVQSHKQPIFKKKTITLQEINDINFIGFDTVTQTGKAIEQYLNTKNISVNIVKEDSNIETIKNAIDVGLGCSILPKTTVLQEIRNKSFDVIHVKGMNIKRPLAIIYKNQKVFSTSTRLFYEMINKAQSNK